MQLLDTLHAMLSDTFTINTGTPCSALVDRTAFREPFDDLCLLVVTHIESLELYDGSQHANLTTRDDSSSWSTVMIALDPLTVRAVLSAPISRYLRCHTHWVPWVQNYMYC